VSRAATASPPNLNASHDHGWLPVPARPPQRAPVPPAGGCSRCPAGPRAPRATHQHPGSPAGDPVAVRRTADRIRSGSCAGQRARATGRRPPDPAHFLARSAKANRSRVTNHAARLIIQRDDTLPLTRFVFTAGQLVGTYGSRRNHRHGHSCSLHRKR
jgi:hypothetical protein